MSVHIGELHTEVVPGSASEGQAEQDPEPGACDHARAAWLARRVGAEGFDD